MRILSALLPLILLLPLPLLAQEQLGDMTIEEFEPRSTLVVEENPLTRAKFPFVDVHSHWFRAPAMTTGAVDSLLMDMDAMNMGVVVNLSGGSGDRLVNAMANMDGRHPSRMVTFANVNFEGIGDPGWGERAADQLRQDVAAGARGLKIYKSLGMNTLDTDGNRVPVDDPRIDPVWEAAADLGIPVLIHSADPANFWQPRDRYNEKWLELKLNPGRFHPPGEGPSFEQIIAEQHNLFARHPDTIFINAHLGWMGNDLGALGELFDLYPNVYSEMGAVIYELGRQPRTGKAFVTKYKDRILFGKDAYNRDEYNTYFRVLETADEYFPYYRKYHAQWKMYGLDLDDDVLQHIYYKNALRLIPGLDPSVFPTQ